MQRWVGLTLCLDVTKAPSITSPPPALCSSDWFIWLLSSVSGSSLLSDSSSIIIMAHLNNFSNRNRDKFQENRNKNRHGLLYSISENCAGFTIIFLKHPSVTHSKSLQAPAVCVVPYKHKHSYLFRLMTFSDLIKPTARCKRQSSTAVHTKAADLCLPHYAAWEDGSYDHEGHPAAYHHVSPCKDSLLIFSRWKKTQRRN